MFRQKKGWFANPGKKFEETRKSAKKDTHPAVYRVVDKTANAAAVCVAGAATVVSVGATAPLFTKSVENLTGGQCVARENNSEHLVNPMYAGLSAPAASFMADFAAFLEYYVGNPAEGKDGAITALEGSIQQVLQADVAARQRKWCDLVLKHQDNPMKVPYIDNGRVEMRWFPNQQEINDAKGSTIGPPDGPVRRL